MKKKPNILTFTVIKNTLFNLKKDDLVTYHIDGDHKTKMYKSTVFITTHIDPRTEPEFFLETENVDYKFDVTDIVMLINRDLGNAIPPNIPLPIIKNSFKRVGSKIVKLVTISYNSGRHQYTIEESKFAKYEKYHFINSKGVVCEDTKGKDEKVDKFRKLSGNYFLTLDEARVKLNSILMEKVIDLSGSKK